jgi:hypothetical protein
MRACCGAAVFCAAAGASPAWAQRATGPFSGLFGGEVTRGRAQSLDFRASVNASYGDTLTDLEPNDILTDPTTILTDPTAAANDDDWLIRSGGIGSVNAGLSYGRLRDRFQFSFEGNGSAQKYSTNSQLTPTSARGATALSVAVGRRTRLNVSGSAAYSPFYQLNPFGGSSGALDPIQPALQQGLAFSVQSARTLGLSGNIALSSQIGRYATVSADVSGLQTQFLDQDERGLGSWGGHALFSYRFTRHLGFHLGYGRQQVRYRFAGSEPIPQDTYDIGLDYNYDDEFRFSRHTTLNFSTATSVVNYQGRTHFNLNGNARLTRGFSRTWSGGIGYTRTTDFTPTFLEPLQSDNMDASISGLLSRSIKWSSGVGYSHSTVGYEDTGTFSTYSATTGLVFALNRVVGLSCQYGIYSYTLPAGSSVLPLLPRLTRQTVSAGLTMWIPLMRSR